MLKSSESLPTPIYALVGSSTWIHHTLLAAMWVPSGAGGKRLSTLYMMIILVGLMWEFDRLHEYHRKPYGIMVLTFIPLPAILKHFSS